MWGFAIITCTVISWVIYGLRAEVREARRLGQYVLERKLGCEVTSFSAPYGTIDDRLARCLIVAGYRTAFTTEDRASTLADHPLSLPRIEVRGGQALATFAQSVGSWKVCT
jgi:hypothetical protein